MSKGPTARGWRVTQRPATAAGDEGREAQREGVIESSFSTLTAKVASIEHQTKYSWWTQNVRASGGTASYIGQALRSTASRCQKCRNGGVPFLDCNLRFGDSRYMERGVEGWGARFRAA